MNNDELESASSQALLLAIGIALVCFLLGLPIVYVSFRRRKKRIADLTAIAEGLNWTFSADKYDRYVVEYPEIFQFRRPGVHFAYNTLVGGLNINGTVWPVRMGDYRFESDDEENPRMHERNFSYCLLKLPYGTVPGFRLRREGAFDAPKASFGFEDINFESVEFSDRFHVTSSDRRFAYDLIYPAMMEFLLASEPPKLDLIRGYCLLTSDKNMWPTSAFREQLDWVVKFFELWPRHLVADLKSR